MRRTDGQDVVGPARSSSSFFFFPLTLSALIAGLLNGGFQGTYSSILEYASRLFPHDPNAQTYFVLMTSNIPLLIIPFALFVAIFVMTGRTQFDDLPRDYPRVLLSLFVGGLIGSVVSSYSVFLFLGSQQKLPDLLSNVIYFTDLIVQQLYVALQIVFVGFTAVCIQYLRRHARSASSFSSPSLPSNINKIPRT